VFFFNKITSLINFQGTQNDADDEGKNFNHEHDDFQLAQSLSVEPDCSNDEELAYRLQKQFEREDEINRQCATTEFKNGVKKGSIQLLSSRFLCKIFFSFSFTRVLRFKRTRGFNLRK
jgi:hypothetical protein